MYPLVETQNATCRVLLAAYAEKGLETVTDGPRIRFEEYFYRALVC